METENQRGGDGMKRALITGITGQDGSYLAELLLGKGYEVWGVIRRKSQEGAGNVEHIKHKLNLIDGDMTDGSSLIKAVEMADPDEVYNLAAQSFVASSWTSPVATAEINGIGVLNLLEAVRTVKPQARFYQASTSEMFGKVQETPQTETTPFYPRSPYGVAKLFGHWMVKNYRESYGMFACSGILFNHESERRGMEFVTRKISAGVAAIASGKQDYIELGNLDARRDWGHAADYVRGMWLMLQQDAPEDYILATGKNSSIREFVEKAFWCVGMRVSWKGSGVDEVGTAAGSIVVIVNPKFYRPAEVETLLGNPIHAFMDLCWTREISFDDLVRRMVESDYDRLNPEECFKSVYGVCP
jgi:GDPmannose 4,6-dehydratase